MKYCSNCGNKLNDGINFCSNCGHKVEIKREIQVKSSQIKRPSAKKESKWGIGTTIAVAAIVIFVLFGCLWWGIVYQQQTYPQPQQPQPFNPNPYSDSEYGYITPWVSTDSGGTTTFYCNGEVVGWGSSNSSVPCMKILSGDPYVKLRPGLHSFYAVKDGISTQEVFYGVSDDEHNDLYLGHLP